MQTAATAIPLFVRSFPRSLGIHYLIFLGCWSRFRWTRGRTGVMLGTDVSI